MSITVNCESCGAVLRTKDSMAGKMAKCPHCGERVQIPAAAADDVFEAEEVGGGGDFDFGGLDPNAGSAAEEGDRKPCPACGEMIMRKAAKCRYCGEIFDPGLKRRSKKSRSGSRHADEDADMTGGDWVVAILCSGIGCILGIVWMVQGKPKGAKMFGVSLLFSILGGVIRVIIESAGRH